MAFISAAQPLNYPHSGPVQWRLIQQKAETIPNSPAIIRPHLNFTPVREQDGWRNSKKTTQHLMRAHRTNVAETNQRPNPLKSIVKKIIAFVFAILIVVPCVLPAGPVPHSVPSPHHSRQQVCQTLPPRIKETALTASIKSSRQVSKEIIQGRESGLQSSDSQKGQEDPKLSAADRSLIKQAWKLMGKEYLYREQYSQAQWQFIENRAHEEALRDGDYSGAGVVQYMAEMLSVTSNDPWTQVLNKNQLNNVETNVLDGADTSFGTGISVERPIFVAPKLFGPGSNLSRTAGLFLVILSLLVQVANGRSTAGGPGRKSLSKTSTSGNNTSSDDWLHKLAPVFLAFKCLTSTYDSAYLSFPLTVTQVTCSSPAALRGIVQGDEIVMINGRPYSTVRPLAAQVLLAPPPGSKVELVVRKKQPAPSTKAPPGGPGQTTTRYKGLPSLERCELVSQRYPMPTVTFFPLRRGPGKEAYVRISEFTGSTPTEFAAALRELGLAGPARRGGGGGGAAPPATRRLVLDLRGNEGGSVAGARAVAGRLLPPSRGFLLLRDARGRTHRLRTPGGGGGPLAAARLGRRARSGGGPVFRDPGFSVTVLADRHTASAAEVLAAALRHHYGAAGRYRQLGFRPTYGKGVAQAVYRLPDGSGLLLTKYLLLPPGGAGGGGGASFNTRGLRPTEGPIASFVELWWLSFRMDMLRLMARAPLPPSSPS